MLIALLAVVAALQTQTPPPVPVAAPVPAAPVSVPAPAPTEAPAEVEPEPEPVVEEPRTREVCRFVDLPGRRFPVRRCRTVPVEG